MRCRQGSTTHASELPQTPPSDQARNDGRRDITDTDKRTDQAELVQRARRLRIQLVLQVAHDDEQ